MDADDKLSAFVRALLAMGPGSPVLGVYLVGSHALADVRPGSDIDFVGVLRRAPDPAERAALALVHERLRGSLPHPFLDGAWVTAADLHRPADQVVPVLRFLGGAPVEPAPGALSPIEWMQLKERGVRLLGPAIQDLGVLVDREEVATSCRRNLVEYWRPQVDRMAELAEIPELQPWIAERVVWIALGIPRLLASIEAGAVLSKTEAGHYALERFPESHTVLEASLEQRRAPRPERVPALAALAPQAVAFGRRCIEVALAKR